MGIRPIKKRILAILWLALVPVSFGADPGGTTPENDKIGFQTPGPESQRYLQQLDPERYTPKENRKIYEIFRPADPETPLGYLVVSGDGGEPAITEIVLRTSPSALYPRLVPAIQERFPEIPLRFDSTKKSEILRWKGHSFSEVPTSNANVTVLRPPSHSLVRTGTNYMRTEGDMAAVLSGEKATRGEDALTEAEFRQLRAEGKIGLVYEKNGTVLGHVIYELGKNRLKIIALGVVKSEAPPVNDVVAALIQRMKRSLPHQKKSEISIEPGATSPAIHRILEANGFQPYGKDGRKGGLFSQFHLDQDTLARQDHFTRLGVHGLSSPAQIESAYQQLLEKHKGVEGISRLLNRSRRTLLDLAKRQEYLQRNRKRLLAQRAHLFPDPFQPQSDSFYERLGASPNMGPAEIEQLKQTHDFLHGPNPEVNRALRILADPHLKTVYDAILSSTEGEDRRRAVSRFLERVEGTGPPETKKGKTPSQAPFALSRNLKYTTSKPSDPNLYQRLGVAQNASHQQIVDAYIEARLKYQGNSATTRRINDAFKVLGRSHLRESYDTIRTDPSSNQEARLRTLLDTAPPVGQPERLPDLPNNRLKVTTPSTGKINLYQRLGVAENSSPETIAEVAKRRLAQFQLTETERQQISEAYAILRDPHRREAYDLIYYGNRKDVETMEEAISVLSTDPLEDVIELIQDWVPAHEDREILEADIDDRIEKEREATVPDPRKMENLYAIAGVSPNATAEKIEQAYKEAVRNSDTNARKALSVLRQPKLREAYDAIAAGSGESPSQKQIDQLKQQAHTAELYAELRALSESKDNPTVRLARGREILTELKIQGSSAEASLIQSLVRAHQSSGDWQSALALAKWIESRLGTQKNRTDEHGEPYRIAVTGARGELAQFLLAQTKDHGSLREVIANYSGLSPTDPIRQQLVEKGRSLPGGGLLDKARLESLVAAMEKSRRMSNRYDVLAEDVVPNLELLLELGISPDLKIRDFRSLIEQFDKVHDEIGGRVHQNFESIRDTIFGGRERLARALVGHFGHTRSDVNQIRKLFKFRYYDPVRQYLDTEYLARPNIVASTLRAFLNVCRKPSSEGQ